MFRSSFVFSGETIHQEWIRPSSISWPKRSNGFGLGLDYFKVELIEESLFRKSMKHEDIRRFDLWYYVISRTYKRFTWMKMKLKIRTKNVLLWLRVFLLHSHFSFPSEFFFIKNNDIDYVSVCSEDLWPTLFLKTPSNKWYKNK